MSSALAIEEGIVSIEEYLAAEEVSEYKHEYHDGYIYAMAGGTPRHADVIGNVIAAFIVQLRGHRCRGSSGEQRIHVEKSNRLLYPDFVVKCPPEKYSPRDKDALTNPALVVEVLSPGTSDYDHVGKFELYAQIPELRDYVLVEQSRILVEHYQRGEGESWILRRYNMREDALKIPNLEIEVPLDEIYEGIEVPSGLLPLNIIATDAE